MSNSSSDLSIKEESCLLVQTGQISHIKEMRENSRSLDLNHKTSTEINFKRTQHSIERFVCGKMNAINVCSKPLCNKGIQDGGQNGQHKNMLCLSWNLALFLSTSMSACPDDFGLIWALFHAWNRPPGNKGIKDGVNFFWLFPCAHKLTRLSFSADRTCRSLFSIFDVSVSAQPKTFLPKNLHTSSMTVQRFLNIH